jgi:hypothetical protein
VLPLGDAPGHQNVHMLVHFVAGIHAHVMAKQERKKKGWRLLSFTGGDDGTAAVEEQRRRRCVQAMLRARERVYCRCEREVRKLELGLNRCEGREEGERGGAAAGDLPLMAAGILGRNEERGKQPGSNARVYCLNWPARAGRKGNGGGRVRRGSRRRSGPGEQRRRRKEGKGNGG